MIAKNDDVHIAALEPENIPEALRASPQWVCWKWKDRDGQRTKIPIAPANGRNASTTTPADWSSFDDAITACGELDCAGVGFVFTAEDDYAGIDLDDCIDADGAICSEAQAIIDAFDSYTEVSPSGRGVKIFIQGVKPDGAKCKTSDVVGFKMLEVYDRDRFFCVTGQIVPGVSDRVEARQDALEALCRRNLITAPPAPKNSARSGSGFSGSDEELIERASNAANGSKFRALMSGDTSGHNGDDSSADLALCNMLAFWTGRDEQGMGRLFRGSGLMRSKWDEMHGAMTYGQMTVCKAIEDCAQVYGDGGSVTPHDESPVVPIDPASGKRILEPNRPYPTAEVFVAEYFIDGGRKTTVCCGGELLVWRDNQYARLEEGAIRSELHPWLTDSLQLSRNGKSLTPFSANKRAVDEVLDAIKSACFISESTASPSWLAPQTDDPDASELVVCRSMSLHLPTMRVIPATPRLFARSALGFDYDPDAPIPVRFFEFLDEVFGDDIQSKELLQEWFGYCLTQDTSLQKILLIVGPMRSGKGTLAKLMQAIVGLRNYANPPTQSLAGSFGMQPLIDKSLVVIADARFRKEELTVITERLLTVSGEDEITIDRKHTSSVTTQLKARVVLMTNMMPHFDDASGAITSRLLPIQLTNSFYGSEDPALLSKLLAEMPGILNWAIEGRRRLRDRGRFVEPESGREMSTQMERMASPVAAFLQDRCEIGVSLKTLCADLYSNWKQWCEQQGLEHGSSAYFGRQLAAAKPTIKRRRTTGNVWVYKGVEIAASGTS